MVNTDLVFHGTPDDWWDNAENILESEASNRTLGNWYIVRQQTAGQTKPTYRVSTPSKPANMDQLLKAKGPHDKVSERVRLLIRSEAETPAWMLSHLVIADTGVATTDGSKLVQRLPWVRKNSGRWQSLYNGSLNINDHQMADLNPAPARITEEEQ